MSNPLTDLFAREIVALALMGLAILWLLGRLLPRGTGGFLVGALLHSAILGVWHRIFGPPYIRIAKPQRRFRRRHRRARRR